MKWTKLKGLTDKQRDLQTGWSCLFIGFASVANIFTRNHFIAITFPMALAAFAHICFINFRRQ